MSSDYKPIEIVTFFTDMAAAIQGFLFGLFLLYFWIKNKDNRKTTTIMWIGACFSIGLFALFGALSHGSDSISVGDALWPPTMIFGGVAFIFLVAGVIIYQKETDYNKLLVIPIVLVIGYLIVCILVNWIFIIWVILLLVCSVIIFIYAFKAKHDNKALAPYLIYGLIIVLIGGVIQAIGSIIGYETMIGPNNEYLFKPHNDIFHIIAIIGVTVLFIGFRKELLNYSK